MQAPDKRYVWRRFVDLLKADSDGAPADEYLIEDLPKILRERIKKITGLGNWKDDPARTLSDLTEEIDAHEADTENPHGVSVEQIGAQPAGDYATNEDLASGLAGKQPIGEYVEEDDPRLSDAREPVEHDHDDRYIQSVNGTGPDTDGNVSVSGGGTPNPGYISGANLEWISSSSVRLSPGSAMVDGTLASWSSALTMPGRKGSANSILYIYLSSSPTIFASTVAPAYDPVLDYWSSGSFRCVGFVQLGGAGEIRRFVQIPTGRSREYHFVPRDGISASEFLGLVQIVAGASNTSAWQSYSLAGYVPRHATHYFASAKLAYSGTGQDAQLGVSPVDLGSNGAGFAMYTVRDSNGNSGAKTFFGRSWLPLHEAQITYARLQISSGTPTYEIECHGARFGV